MYKPHLTDEAFFYRALEAHPTINDELPFRILTGSVKVTKQISYFTETGERMIQHAPICLAPETQFF